jgi:hypothetical protein
MWNGKTYPVDVPPETWGTFTSLHDADYDRINSRIVELIALDVATDGQLVGDYAATYNDQSSDLPTEVQYELDSILGPRQAPDDTE